MTEDHSSDSARYSQADGLSGDRECSAAHTPGPWTVTSCLDYWVDHGRPITDADKGFRGVAHCGDIAWPNFDAHQAEWEANARLITAAPDMLAVLQEMFCEPGPVVVALAGNPIACDALEARARAAIAKALGTAGPSEPKALVPSAAPHPGMNQKAPS